MNLPTADMQRDKTFLAGGNWLNRHATVPRWWYDTWNYYINITISLGWKPGICVRDTRPFPLITAITPAIGYRLLMASSPTRTVLSFSFTVMERRWGKEWTPQVVIGANDGIAIRLTAVHCPVNRNRDTGMVSGTVTIWL